MMKLNSFPKAYLILMATKLTRLRKAHTGLKLLVRKLGFGVVTVRFIISVWNMFTMLHLTACIWGTVGMINLEGGNSQNWITANNLQDVTNPL